MVAVPWQTIEAKQMIISSALCVSLSTILIVIHKLEPEHVAQGNRAEKSLFFEQCFCVERAYFKHILFNLITIIVLYE